MREKTVIGWREWVGLPDLGVERIKAKIDTGARTSALHAFDLSTEIIDGVEHARFTIYPIQRSHESSVRALVPVVDHRRIRSSNGAVQSRPVVQSTLTIGGWPVPIDITLTGRDEMGFRLLIGRAAIRRLFVVDPARSYLAGRVPKGSSARRRGGSRRPD